MKLEQIYPELEEIKNEIRSLKILIIEKSQTKQVVSIGGALKGIKISEEDIEEAKKSVFKFGV